MKEPRVQIKYLIDPLISNYEIAKGKIRFLSDCVFT